MQALTKAVSDPMNASDGCNSGFMRPDSILVATLITDEEDDPSDENGGSEGDPASWKQIVVDAKGGESGVVMLGLVGETTVCNGFNGNDGGEDSPRLQSFVTSFDRHVLGSVCEPNYAPFFEQAVDLITETCTDFVPPE